jgi:hypothetical protein
MWDDLIARAILAAWRPIIRALGWVLDAVDVARDGAQHPATPRPTNRTGGRA